MKISSARTVLNFMNGNMEVMSMHLNYMKIRRMLTRHTKTDLIIYVAFWVLYAPLVLLRWHSEKGNLIEISFILLIGLGIVLSGLLLYRYSHNYSFRRLTRRTNMPKTDEQLEPEIEEDVISEQDEFLGFRTLFSTNGGEAI